MTPRDGYVDAAGAAASTPRGGDVDAAGAAASTPREWSRRDTRKKYLSKPARAPIGFHAAPHHPGTDYRPDGEAERDTHAGAQRLAERRADRPTKPRAHRAAVGPAVLPAVGPGAEIKVQAAFSGAYKRPNG